MVFFKDLRITPDGKQLLISTSVAPYKFYDSMYISKITIYTEDTWSPSGPSAPDPCYDISFDDSPREKSLVLKAEDMKDISSLGNHIFYVYVSLGGVPSEDPGCGWDRSYTLGVVLYWEPIYRLGMNYMRKTVQECCDLDKSFIDYILRLKSFELALRTAQYPLANEKYIKWFRNVNDTVAVRTSGCGC